MDDLFDYLTSKAGSEAVEQTFADVPALDPLTLSYLDVQIISDIDKHTLGGIIIMTNVADLAITSLDVITAFELDGTPAFVLDELQDTTISNTQDKEDITGKGGRKIATIKRNKAVTVSGNNGLVSSGLLEAQTGGTFEEKASAPVQWTDYLTVASNEATTSYKAVGTAGAEIEALYVRTPAGVASTKLTQASAAATGKFAYAPATKKLTFSGLEDGTEIVVFYTRNVPANVLANNTENYSKTLRVYIDGTAEDKCGNIFHIQFFIPKGDFNGEFDFEMGDNQSVHAFEIESLSGGSCGTGNSGDLWTYTVFGADAEDAA